MSQKLPVHEVLLKVKQYMIKIEGLPTTTLLVSGHFLGKEGKYYQLTDLLLAIINNFKLENGQVIIDLDDLNQSLLGKSVDVYDLLKSIDKLTEGITNTPKNENK